MEISSPTTQQPRPPSKNQWLSHFLRHFFDTHIKPVVSLDLRSLGALRIGVAFAALVDLTIRFSDLEAHYSNTGVLPLEALFRYVWNPGWFSFYTITGNWHLQAIVFIINYFCLGCLLFGYRTRLFTVLSWLFILSLHNRNPVIQQGGDDLLRMMLFWGMFLPWEYYYSVDAGRIEKPANLSNQYVSVAGFAFVCQIFYVYFFTALLKSSPEWSSDYTALYYALSLDQILTPLGRLIYPYGDILKIITMLTYYIELVLPFFLLVPFFNAYFRIAFIVIICFFHLGISLFLYVGLFPVISVVSLLGLVPVLVSDSLRDSRHRVVVGIRRLTNATGTYFGFLVRPNQEPVAYIPAERPLKGLVLLFFLGYVFCWNMGTTGRSFAAFDQVRWLGNTLRLDQFWGMFAPAVFKDDGWFVLPGKTRDGREIDLVTQGGKVDFVKPAKPADFYKNDRWRKYHENLLFVNKSHFRPYYCNYLLNHWNASHADQYQLTQLQVIYMKEVTLPDYQPVIATKEVLSICGSE